MMFLTTRNSCKNMWLMSKDEPVITYAFSSAMQYHQPYKVGHWWPCLNAYT